MAEWRRRYPLDDVRPRPGEAPLRLTVRNGVAAMLVMARAPEAEARLAADGVTVCPAAPGQWLLMADRGADGAFAAAVHERLGDLAHVSEQSHGRQVIRVAGPATLELLMRGCRLDLQTAAPGFTAQSPVAGFGCLLRVVDATPTIDLVVAAGYARPFWRWLTVTAEPFGSTVEVWTAPLTW